MTGENSDQLRTSLEKTEKIRTGGRVEECRIGREVGVGEILVEEAGEGAEFDMLQMLMLQLVYLCFRLESSSHCFIIGWRVVGGKRARGETGEW